MPFDDSQDLQGAGILDVAEQLQDLQGAGVLDLDVAERLQDLQGAGVPDLGVAERFQAHRGGTAEAMAVMVQEQLGTQQPWLASYRHHCPTSIHSTNQSKH